MAILALVGALAGSPAAASAHACPAIADPAAPAFLQPRRPRSSIIALTQEVNETWLMHPRRALDGSALRRNKHDEQKESLFYRMLGTALPKLRRRVLPHNQFGDNLYHRLLFLKKHKRFPKNQMLWNDVLYRIKTTDEILDPLRVFVSDKEQVKNYIKATVGDQYNVPTIAVLHSPAEVDRFEFPARCCIKPTHASAQYILRKQGEPIDRARIKSWFRYNYYHAGRERELPDAQTQGHRRAAGVRQHECQDYKHLLRQRRAETHPGGHGPPHPSHAQALRPGLERAGFLASSIRGRTRSCRGPTRCAEMLRVARALSAPFSFVRIDLYSDNQRVLVGEITNVQRQCGRHLHSAVGGENAPRRCMFG